VKPSGSSQSAVPPTVRAVVLTHRRPRLATATVRSLIEREGLSPERVVVVVNGSGGLEDPDLEKRVRMVRLDRNLGPAGGFAAGIRSAFDDPRIRWAYLCEDDVGLYSLPCPRLADLVLRTECLGTSDRKRVGAVVAFGRRFVGRGVHTLNHVPPEGVPCELGPVDVGSWGATLLARQVFEAGVQPDPNWFFGLEDFDFYCRIRERGFEVLVDAVSARAVAGEQTSFGRAGTQELQRPTNEHEVWRQYYHFRNSVEMVRRHGNPSWHLWNLAYAVRHLQSASGREERVAIVHGLWDGVRGRLGEHPSYGRSVGEWSDDDGQ
jgi:rhamnopyranosyl-N-acetylglucosaminyl-diphospho-decaprenol beta-1,3/1,4-galactofuranosyltransferase